MQHQCLYRQSAAWKDSLRFRKPQLSQMSGLRRVTLNLNNNIGDRGGSELAEALRDDVCLKGKGSYCQEYVLAEPVQDTCQRALKDVIAFPVKVSL